MENSFIEITAKTIGLLGSIFTAYKLFLEVVVQRKSRLREEYKFVKDFLTDINSNHSTHPYLVEKGFAAIAGKDNLTSPEILFLLKQPNPSVSLKRYSTSMQRYVYYNKSAERVDFRKKFTNQTKRRWSKILNIIGYVFFSCLALVPLFFASDIFGKNWQLAVVVILIFFGAFGPQAIFRLAEITHIIDGEKLVENQSSTIALASLPKANSEEVERASTTLTAQNSSESA